MADKDPRHIARAREETAQRAVVDAVAKRNAELVAGANPDPNVGTGFYGGEAAPEQPKGKGK